MASLPTSGFRLFKAFGIQVYVHWSWLVVAMIEIQVRKSSYSSLGWNIAEYLALFAIVTMHEFGHSLACRSVGGQADRIMLWPLGGVAFVQPPPRPGAVLWSIAAGPLVNVVLIPVLIAAMVATGAWTVWWEAGRSTDLQHFVTVLTFINLSLFIFNMLPIYPLDGGQILRALLWFMIGQRRSLLVASVIGLIGAGAGVIFAISVGSMWITIMAAFAAMQSWAGFQRARLMSDQPDAPPRVGIQCPSCGVAPPPGAYWTCPCGKAFDVFESRGTCPNCGGMFTMIPCPACQQLAPPGAWFTPTQPPQPVTPRPPLITPPRT